MLGPHWFLRMKRWVQDPPAPRRVLFVFAIVAVCLLVYGLEQAGLWPDWMQADRVARRPGLGRF